MKLFVVVYDDAALLGHFLRHYKDAGVTHFCIATSQQLRPEIDHFIEEGYPIEVFTDLVIDDWMGNSGNSAVTQMRQKRQQPGEWVVIVDLDEFILFDMSLRELVRTAVAEGANSVRALMFDRFARDGQPTDFKPDDDLSRVYPIKARFMQRVGKGFDAKYVLVKGHMQAIHHHHSFADARPYSRYLEIAHYKWRGGSVDRLKRNIKQLQERGVGWRFVYQNMIDHYNQYGRFFWQTFGGIDTQSSLSENAALRSTRSRVT